MLLVAGCGGSGSSEDSLRQKIEAGVAKLAAAQSLEASELYEVEGSEAEEAEAKQIGCIEESVERWPPTKLDMRAYDRGCEGGSDGHEVIAIGNRVWTTIEPGRYAEATIDPSVPTGLTDEKARFKKLLAAAKGIQPASAEVAFIEPDGKAATGPTYEFTAPASSLYGRATTDETAKFEATLDSRGYLRQLRVTAGKQGAGAIVTQTYAEIEQPQRIAPPSPAEVSGPVTRVESRKEFEALLGPRPGESGSGSS